MTTKQAEGKEMDKDMPSTGKWKESRSEDISINQEGTQGCNYLIQEATWKDKEYKS